MDQTTVITTLAGVVASLSGFIVLLFRLQLADKDKIIDKQQTAIERQQVTVEALASGLKESLMTMHELQAVTEQIERELSIRKAVEKRRPGTG